MPDLRLRFGPQSTGRYSSLVSLRVGGWVGLHEWLVTYQDGVLANGHPPQRAERTVTSLIWPTTLQLDQATSVIGALDDDDDDCMCECVVQRKAMTVTWTWSARRRLATARSCRRTIRPSTRRACTAASPCDRAPSSANESSSSSSTSAFTTLRATLATHTRS